MPSVLERLRSALAPNFTVERELASGGMGTVFLGRDLALDRRVAIKILRPELSTAVAVERFVREAQYLASLNHPNIVPVHLAGDADGLVYYIMDYVDGETLDTRLARGPLTAAEVNALGRDLLGALAAAHRTSVIHRDIKPANIFLVGGRAMLGDFGIARTAEGKGETLTAPGQVIGTLAYMAPEQLSGSPVTTRTDLYAVGLVLYQAYTGRRWDLLVSPEQADWSGVPANLAEVLGTALQMSPEHRWDSAESFAKALTDSRSRSRWSRLAPLVPLAALMLYTGLRWLWPSAGPQASNVAVYPFEVAGLADTALGSQLARLTASYLEALPGLTVAPVRTTFREWRESSLPPGERLTQLSAGKRGAEYGVWGVVRPGSGGVEVQLQAVNARGEPVLSTVVRGDSSDRIGLGDSISLQLVRKVFPRSRHLYRSAGGFAGVNPRAVPEFLFGEDASERDAWLTAERHYLNALALDSTFVLAAWRLANARRWMPLRSDPPLIPGFLELYRAHRTALGPIDQLLVDAQFAPSGKPRFDIYEEALRRAPRDAYPALYYGDELFHRGPLSGRSRDEAITMLQRAVALDSSLAPAHEHLAWALIRSGRKEEARRSLDALDRVAGNPEESEIYLPVFLEIAFATRFQTKAPAADQSALQSPFALGLAARGGLSFDMPEAQAALGAGLATLRSAPPALHGSGQIAQGVAFMAMGRPTLALSHFDAAVRLLPEREEARLQAAEWRVIPSALGLPGVPSGEIEQGRRELGRMAGDSTLGQRAAWVLAFDELRRGNRVAAAPWVVQVASSSQGENPYHLILRAMQQAAAGNLDTALQVSQSALAFDSAGRAGDPFFRAALHLQRGEWYAAAGDGRAADASWLWYENLDAVGWPRTVAQAVEVDWALGTYARWRRGRLANSTGQPGRACRLMTEVTAIWNSPEPPVEQLMVEAREVIRGCPR